MLVLLAVAFAWTLDDATLESFPPTTQLFVLGDAAAVAARVLCETCEIVLLQKKWTGVVDPEIVAAFGGPSSFVLRSVPGAPDTVLFSAYQGPDCTDRYIWYQGKDPQRADEADELRKEMRKRSEEVGAQLKTLQARLATVESSARGVGSELPSEVKIRAWMKEAGITRRSQISVEIRTNQGTISCTLWPKKAPLTVANFVSLAEGRKAWKKNGVPTKEPLYNGTIFHRVVPGSLIQGGDPLGTGQGGSGEKFEDEPNDAAFSEPGRLAMASSGSGSNSSQFFITVGENLAWLHGKPTIFGTCDPEVPMAISKVKAEHDRPIEPVIIETITIRR